MANLTLLLAQVLPPSAPPPSAPPPAGLPAHDFYGAADAAAFRHLTPGAGLHRGLDLRWGIPAAVRVFQFRPRLVTRLSLALFLSLSLSLSLSVSRINLAEINCKVL